MKDYKFTLKSNPKVVKTGELLTAGQGWDDFKLSDGEIVRANNVERDGSNLNCELYIIEQIKPNN